MVGWDRDAVAMKTAVENGMTIAAHPRAVADAADGTVISIITEDNGVRNIFRGKDGFLSGDARGMLFIEMSTLQPMTGRELAPAVESALAMAGSAQRWRVRSSVSWTPGENFEKRSSMPSLK